MTTAATSKRILNINTVDAPKLDLKLSSNTVDFNILSVPRETERDVLKEPYMSMSKSLGYSALLKHGVVQTSRYAHPALNGGGKGYNGRREDFVGDKDNTYEGYGNGVLIKNWKNDFNEVALSFAQGLGIHCDLCANVEHGSWEELEFEIDMFNPEVIFFGAEVATYMSAEKYRDIASDWITKTKAKNPNIKCVLIPGLIYRVNPKSTELSQMVATMEGDGHNQYFQLHDRIKKDGEQFGEDMNENADMVNFYFTHTMNNDLEDCLKLYGEEKKMYIGEWLIEDNRKDQYGREVIQYVNNTMLGMSAIARMFEFCIRNNDYIKYLAWMSHGNLISNDDVMSNNGLAISLVTKMTNGRRKVTQLECDGLPGGVTLTTVKDGKKHYVLINNISNEVTAIDEVYVDGKLVKVPFNQSGYYGSSWGGRIDTLSGSGYDIPIPDHSFQVAEFDLS